MSDDANRANGKPEHLDRAAGLWRRVSEHKLVQWAVAYIAIAYAIQHGVILTAESLEWPALVARVSMLLLALGLPLVMLLAWYHGHHASRHVSKVEFSIISLLLVVGSLWFYVFVKPSEEATASRAQPQESGVAEAQKKAADPHGAISVAVLPFVNLSSDKEQEFFSDGMTEEITTALAKVPDLRVVARESAFQYKGEKNDMRAVGQALNATHLITGSVRKAGDRVRITAQLVKADDGVNVWTDNYDRELNDIFAIQEDIAKAIATSLRVPLGLREGESLVSNRNIDGESYQQYLRAKALVRSRGTQALADAARLLEQVVTRYPDYAPAWAALALDYDQTPRFGPVWFTGTVEELRAVVDANLPKAEAAARRAIQLDANLADGYVSLGIAQHRRSRLLQANDSLTKALALDPANPDALQGESNLLAHVGHLKESLAMKQRLVALEPFAPVFSATAGQVMWMIGLPGAEALYSKSNNDEVWRPMAYAAEGRYSDAADAMQHLPPGIASRARIEAAVRLLRMAPTKAIPPENLPALGHLGFVYLYTGAPERALEVYERNIDAGYVFGVDTSKVWHASFTAVRKTERFKGVIRKGGYVEYWRAKGWPQWCHPVGADDFACE